MSTIYNWKNWISAVNILRGGGCKMCKLLQTSLYEYTGSGKLGSYWNLSMLYLYK